MTTTVHLDTSYTPRGRRARAMPDLHPGRAYSTGCSARFISIFSNDRGARPDPLPRSGTAHAAFVGGSVHA